MYLQVILLFASCLNMSNLINNVGSKLLLNTTPLFHGVYVKLIDFFSP